ncbi:MAG: hypothetical protein IK025_05035 [Bacteroidales bacterium]|nr:hypothetical protein [Bacteroidales bacterium]
MKRKEEHINLTNAKALLLFILFDLVRHGEFVSEFSSEKVCYFLQKFGAADLFNLHYEPKYYGPYSGKVKYVLNAFNGNYIMNYNDINNKPFDPLLLIADSYQDVVGIVENDELLKAIAQKTTTFLDGFYSDFALELLSSVDYIMSQYGNIGCDEIYGYLSKWNDRKSALFSNPKYIAIAREHLLEHFKYES